MEISIHALREEGDLHPGGRCRSCGYFYPRPPRGGRRLRHAVLPRMIHFYPRPPRGGRLRDPFPPPSHPEHFYPRPPRGGRHKDTLDRLTAAIFLSTPSARRATPRPSKTQGLRSISIHALREEGDLLQFSAGSISGHISIHALREEGDKRSASSRSYGAYFYPRPPRGGRPMDISHLSSRSANFYPRPPRGGRHPTAHRTRQAV